MVRINLESCISCLPKIILFLADALGFSLILDQRFYTIETLIAGIKNHQR